MLNHAGLPGSVLGISSLPLFLLDRFLLFAEHCLVHMGRHMPCDDSSWGKEGVLVSVIQSLFVTRPVWHRSSLSSHGITRGI